MNEKRQCPARLKALDEKLIEISTEVKISELELEALKKEHRNIDQEITTVDSKIQKSNNILVFCALATIHSTRTTIMVLTATAFNIVFYFKTFGIPCF